jgi:L-serine deaminase
MTAGLVVVLAGALAVGIGALALHNNAKNPKTSNAADKQVDADHPGKTASSSPPQAGAPVPVPIAPPGKAGPGQPGGPAGKATPASKKSTQASQGSTQHQTAGGSTPQRAQIYHASVQTVEIVGYASGKCIDVTKGQSGVPIEIWNCDPVTDLKRWVFYSDGTVRSQGQCMTVAGGSGNGAPIEVTSCNGGSAQRFNLNNAHDLVNVAADKCVDVKDKQTGNGTPLQLWSCGGTSNQKWHT